MDGKAFRLARLLGRADKLVVAAVDHGAFHGPIAGLEDPVAACSKLTGADAVLMAPGMIRHVAHLFAAPQSPWLITRLLWNSTYCFQWNYSQSRHRTILSVAQAVALGADVVLASLSINTGSEEVDADNAGRFSACVQQAAELGVPIIGEYYPAGTQKMSSQELHENIRIGCRVAAELGADLIKTFYTGPQFRRIAESAPAPILVLGAEKTPQDRDALKLARDAAAAGARGIVFGRNILQSANPAGFVQAVRAVMNQQTDIDQAVRQYGLT
jgi:DhnA family fructose-bisphosphate aldolase class Ia